MDASEAGKRLSALGAAKGGVARAKKLSPAERQRIARAGASARWGSRPSGDEVRTRRADEVPGGGAGCGECARRAEVVRRRFDEFVRDAGVRQAIGRIPWGGFRARVMRALEGDPDEGGGEA